MWIWDKISELFNTSGTSAQAPRVSVNRDLLLAGWEVDQAEAFSEPLAQIQAPRDTFLDTLQNDRNFQNWRSYILKKAHHWRNSYPSGDTWPSAWWRTLCADSCWGANCARRMTRRPVLLVSHITANESRHHR